MSADEQHSFCGHLGVLKEASELSVGITAPTEPPALSQAPPAFSCLLIWYCAPEQLIPDNLGNYYDLSVCLFVYRALLNGTYAGLKVVALLSYLSCARIHKSELPQLG